MQPREAYLALNMMHRIGPVRVRGWLEAVGEPAGLFTRTADDLQKTLGPSDTLDALLSQRDELPWREEIEKAEAAGIQWVTPADDEYPSVLTTMHDPPLALYIRGEWKTSDRHALALVGCRQCTHYGRQVADRLGYQLAQAGFTVLSGLARGIDTAAHKGALKAKGRTIAVIGSGLFKLYPPESTDLADAIAASGAVVSEYPLERAPDRTTFPYRNRLISGFSLGTVVVEAGSRSGALHTADAAMDQGKSVFAVPGRIDAPTARGPNRLIKQGARLVDDVKDIFDEFEYLEGLEQPSAKTRGKKNTPDAMINDAERAVLLALAEGHEDADALGRTLGLTSAELSTQLFGLEMKKIIRMLPGRRVALRTHADQD